MTHVPHFAWHGRVSAYSPYAIEIAEWAALARQVVIASPMRRAAPPADCAVIKADNIVLVRQPETGGHSLRAKLRQVALLPWSVLALARAMRTVDAVHVRCPGNIGLLGALLAPIACRRRVAKYAGQWSAFPNEPWSVQLQRWILRSRWWAAPVLVYDSAPSATAHVVPFFASVLNSAHIARARTAAQRRRRAISRILYVGRLTEQKNVAILIRALAMLRHEGVAVECVVVGDGPERSALLSEVQSLGVGDQVRFDGACDQDAVLARYEWADALVLPSESEGWPKALAEAMAFGLCCIGPNRGIIPWMLGEGRGVVVTPGLVDELATAIRSLATAGDELSAMRAAAADWAQQFTIERFGSTLRQVLGSHWYPVDSTRPAALRV